MVVVQEPQPETNNVEQSMSSSNHKTISFSDGVVNHNNTGIPMEISQGSKNSSGDSGSGHSRGGGGGSGRNILSKLRGGNTSPRSGGGGGATPNTKRRVIIQAVEDEDDAGLDETTPPMLPPTTTGGGGDNNVNNHSQQQQHSHRLMKKQPSDHNYHKASSSSFHLRSVSAGNLPSLMPPPSNQRSTTLNLHKTDSKSSDSDYIPFHSERNHYSAVSFAPDDALERSAAVRKNDQQQGGGGRNSIKDRILSNVLDLSSSANPRQKGSGFLASRRDLSMNEDDFAGGCKLLLAAARGDINMIVRILKVFSPRVTVDFRDYDRRTALHIAASEGHFEMVKFLIEKKGAAVNRSDRWGGSPLDDAHRHRHSDVAYYIRSCGGTTGSTDLTANLISAASEGDLDEVVLLVQSCGVDVNAADYDKRTALHLASAADQEEVVKYLLDIGKANPNMEDRWGGKPLDDALRNESKKSIPLLEAAGAIKGNPTRSSANASNLPKKGSFQLSDQDGGGTMDDDDFFHVDFTELEMIERIGGGAFGDIYKCRWRGTLVAAKCIKDAKIAKDWKRRTDNMKRVSARAIPPATTVVSTPFTLMSGLRSKTSSRRNSFKGDGDPGGGGTSSGIEVVQGSSSSQENGNVGMEYSSTKLPSHILTAKLEEEKKKEQQEKDATNAGSDEMSQTARIMALEDFKTELNILKKLRHPNICLLLGYSTTQDYQVMVSELMKCSLLDVFKANAVHNIIFSMKKQASYAHQIAAGMNYLHTGKPPIIHRDLKPANILLSYTGTCKITDFGLAKIRADPQTDEKDEFRMTGETGTYRFMAPEVFRHEQYTEKVDVYSFAMILFYMSSGHAPWPTKNGVVAAADAAVEGKRPLIPRSWDSQWSNLLQQCWDENPSCRPSFKAILGMLEEYSNDVLKTDMQIDHVDDRSRTSCDCNCVIS